MIEPMNAVQAAWLSRMVVREAEALLAQGHSVATVCYRAPRTVLARFDHAWRPLERRGEAVLVVAGGMLLLWHHARVPADLLRVFRAGWDAVPAKREACELSLV